MWILESISHDPRFSQAIWTYPCCLSAADTAIGPLRSPQGKHLRATATPEEPSHRTAKAVEWLRMNYAKTLRVEELATMARMGVSTLHRQFRSLTTMSTTTTNIVPDSICILLQRMQLC